MSKNQKYAEEKKYYMKLFGEKTNTPDIEMMKEYFGRMYPFLTKYDDVNKWLITLYDYAMVEDSMNMTKDELLSDIQMSLVKFDKYMYESYKSREDFEKSYPHFFDILNHLRTASKYELVYIRAALDNENMIPTEYLQRRFGKGSKSSGG